MTRSKWKGPYVGADLFKENKKNTQPLDFYIQMIIPIILDLVDKFENEIEKEYPADLIEKQMAIEYKKN